MPAAIRGVEPGGSMFQDIYTARGGPGRVVLQTMPISNFASSIAAMIPSKG